MSILINFFNNKTTIGVSMAKKQSCDAGRKNVRNNRLNLKTGVVSESQRIIRISRAQNKYFFKNRMVKALAFSS